jgi:hypothetical protein
VEIASDTAQVSNDQPRQVHPGWASHAVTASVLVFATWEFSSPGARLWMWIILLVAGAGLAAYWLLGLPASILYQRSLPTKRAWAHWLVIPVAAAAAVALWQSSAPLHARFAVSRPAMDDLATQLASSRETSAPNQRLGLYWAEDIERVEGAVRFHVASSGFGNNAGFVYSPAHAPPRVGENTYVHLAGPWYLWEESW